MVLENWALDSTAARPLANTLHTLADDCLSDNYLNMCMNYSSNTFNLHGKIYCIRNVKQEHIDKW